MLMLAMMPCGLFLMALPNLPRVRNILTPSLYRCVQAFSDEAKPLAVLR